MQVLLVGDTHDKQTLSLRDVDGTFVDAGPLHETRNGGVGDDPEDHDETERAKSSSKADLILRLERTFRSAYGHDVMSVETKDTLLYGQLQHGLRLELMQGPAVSGARNYQDLCISAKNEDNCLADLKRRQECAQVTKQSTTQQQAGPKQLLDDPERSRKLVAKVSQFTLIDSILFYVDGKRGRSASSPRETSARIPWWSLWWSLFWPQAVQHTDPTLVVGRYVCRCTCIL